MALFAGVATLIIAVIGAVATYIDNYYTTSVGQWVANDLRICIYEHLHRLSLRFYDTAKTGALMSTITSDVATIQSFASSSTLSIIVDIITIVFMIGLMFWLDWDFTLIALAITPFLLMAVMHFKRAVKEVTRTVRARQSEVVAVVQEGLRIGTSRKGIWTTRPRTRASRSGKSRHGRGCSQSSSGEVAVVAHGQHRGRDLHRYRAVEGNGPDRRRDDDGRRAYGLSRLPCEVLQAGKRSRKHDQRDCADDGGA